MFWGMTLEPGELYTEIMQEEVQLSMAAIDSRKGLDETPGTNFCQIVIQTEKGEYVLCTLVHGVMFQQNLDLKLMPREKVTFSVQGPSVVYLVGYTASYPEDADGVQPEEYEEDSSAWESFQEGDPAFTQIKEEPVEILDNSDTEIEDNDDNTEVHNQIATSSQAETEGTVTEQPGDEEMIFSVAAVDPPVVKAEPTDPDVDPPVTSGVMAPSQQELPLQDDLFSMQTSDHGIILPQTTAAPEFFNQDTLQQQTDVPLTPPPVAFQPMTSGPEYQNPQTGVLPPAEIIQPPMVQRVQAGPIRHLSSGARGNVPSVNNQRTYPPQRRQYGTNRGKSPGRGRGRPYQQQNRSIQQQQPGTSQQMMPGPSTSGYAQFSVAGGYAYETKPTTHYNRPLGTHAPNYLKRTPQALSGQKAGPTAVSKSSDSTTAKVIFCRTCGKQFTDPHKLVKHEAYHAKVRQHVCSECDRSFHTRENLVRHGRVHTGERPYKCDICGERFKLNAHLARHRKIHYR